jgi:hypothetical protein
MAFLAPIFAKGAATTATTSLGTGIATGLKMSSTVGLKAPTAFAFAPNIGGAGSQLLTSGSLLAPSTGGGLGSLLGAGSAGLKAAPFLAPAAGGLGGALTPTGLASLQMPAGSLLKGGTTLAGSAPSSFSAVNQAVGLGDLGFKSAQLNPSFIKTASNVPQAGGNFTKGLLESGAKIKPAPTIDVAGEAAKWQQYATNAGYTTPGGPAAEITRSMVPKGLTKGANAFENFGNLLQNPSWKNAKEYIEEHPYATAAAGYGLYNLMKPEYKPPPKDKALIRPYEFTQTQRPEAYAGSPLSDTSERMYFDTSMTAKAPYEAPGPEYAADGGLMGYAVGGPVETMAAMNAVGANTGYPMAGINTAMYSNPMVQRPEAVNVISPSGDAGVSAYSGEPKFAIGGNTKNKDNEPPYAYTYDPKTLQFTQTQGPKVGSTVGGIGALVGGQGAAPVAATPAYPALSIPAYQTPEQRLGLTDFYAMMDRRLGQMGGYAAGGGISDLGAYSDGGRLLKGPGDGVSDSIPAVIGERQPARLADGEFVIPARIVSELGNGSTEAGARKLYAMMDRVQKARGKTVGKDKVAANTKADKHLPA